MDKSKIQENQARLKTLREQRSKIRNKLKEEEVCRVDPDTKEEQRLINYHKAQLDSFIIEGMNFYNSRVATLTSLHTNALQKLKEKEEGGAFAKKLGMRLANIESEIDIITSHLNGSSSQAEEVAIAFLKRHEEDHIRGLLKGLSVSNAPLGVTPKNEQSSEEPKPKKQVKQVKPRTTKIECPNEP